MLVKNWMTHSVITIDKSDPIALAKQLMTENKIRELPVVSEGVLVGIVTDRDLKRAFVSESTGLEAPKVAYLNTRIKVAAIMTNDVITANPDTTVDEVAKILLKMKISGLPVVDETGKLIGIITLSDVFRLLISLTGIETEGTQIAIETTTEPGTVRDFADIVRGAGGRISSLLTSYDKVPEGYRHVYIKAIDIAPEKVDDLIKELEAKVKVLYVIEHFGDDSPPKVVLMNV
jgi:acetoin utilization protein AcuB